jgi:hypothetical protein
MRRKWKTWLLLFAIVLLALCLTAVTRFRDWIFVRGTETPAGQHQPQHRLPSVPAE